MPVLRPALRYGPAWFALGLLIAAGIVVGSLLPTTNLPDLDVSDKFEHALAYTLLAFWYGSIVGRRALRATFVALLAFGGAIELLQGWMGLGRTADLHGPGRQCDRHPRRPAALADALGSWAQQSNRWLRRGRQRERCFRRPGAATAGRPDAAADARRVRRPATPAGTRPGAARRNRSRAAAFHDPVGTARHRQDHAGTAVRAHGRRGVHRAVGRDGRREGHPRGGGRGARRMREQGRATVLFLDEVHRFNKAQQDLFLPFVEDGTIVFIGATTENPSFEVVGALLSRARVYVLKSTPAGGSVALLRRALADAQRGLRRAPDAWISASTTRRWRRSRAAADGDARRALGTARDRSRILPSTDSISARAGRRSWRLARAVASTRAVMQFYDQISALHKAVRGSDPDASLYWLARMLDGGCDPAYLARRIIRMADRGHRPRLIRARCRMALEAWEAYERLGSPEGELALAAVRVFLAVAPKSNAVYVAFGAAREDVAQLRLARGAGRASAMHRRG